MVAGVADSVVERARPIIPNPTEWQNIEIISRNRIFHHIHGYKKNRSVRCLFFFVTPVTRGKAAGRSSDTGILFCIAAK